MPCAIVSWQNSMRVSVGWVGKCNGWNTGWKAGGRDWKTVRMV